MAPKMHVRLCLTWLSSKGANNNEGRRVTASGSKEVRFC
ncbi:unnamed protein product [Protopolystoma xenopodis]|uniref:Uncharacterized protein n=1 Tax=Protopolystoma xenopodis TaxID=117903 RepID=A0A3S5CHQ1_9PLAT|nr:unnamed protein product [Protopolystoma xenopodis]